MQRYQVTKTFEFSYGHRLVGHNGKCRYLHGHNGVVEVDIDADHLDAMGMVIDFGDVNEAVELPQVHAGIVGPAMPIRSSC